MYRALFLCSVTLFECRSRRVDIFCIDASADLFYEASFIFFFLPDEVDESRHCEENASLGQLISSIEENGVCEI